jgi:signal transduction histidine kinase
MIKPFSVAELLARVDGQLALVQLRGETRASEERQRLARDLHDSVAQSLYSLRLLAYGVRQAFEGAQATQVKEYLDRLDDAAQQAAREMRLLMYQLYPGALVQDGLVHAIDRRLDLVERRAGVTAQLVVEGDLDLATTVVEAFYYISQEALNNALKHAAASEVTVYLSCVGDTATLIVSDNGHGFDHTDASGAGLGLVSMRERAERIGASFVIQPMLTGGTRVRVERRLRGVNRRLAAMRTTAPTSAGGDS